MTEKRDIEYIESGNTYIDDDIFINLWYGNIDRQQWSCDYEEYGALIPSENSKDITLQIAKNEITPDEAKELLGLLSVMYGDVKARLEKIAGLFALTERVEFRLTTDELNTLTSIADHEGTTRSEMLRVLIHLMAKTHKQQE